MQNPFTRWFYPGTENPAVAGIVHVSDKAEVLRFDLSLPAPQHERAIQGVVFWPDGRPAERVNIFLEDPRWPWQTNSVASTTDKQGRFTAHVSTVRGTECTRRLLCVGVGQLPPSHYRSNPAGTP